MLVPRGKAGKDFITELTRIINLFVYATPWEGLALPLLHIFIPMMLQKPSSKSKAKDHAKYLKERLIKWSGGFLEEVMKEAREIQKRLHQQATGKQRAKSKLFCNLMLMGKVSQACKLINNSDSTIGVHAMTDEVMNTLRMKHPAGTRRRGNEKMPAQQVQTVIYEGIDAEAVRLAAKSTFGSGGPTHLDADGWKHILCSKSYGNVGVELCEAIAEMAKKMCSVHVNPESLKQFLACRLIPLDKNPGVRPIGVGEVLRRIIGKTLVHLIKGDIIQSAGTLQTCSGLEGGLEAAVHAMADKFNHDSCQGMLLVDATNAFNSLHREQALDEIAERCPVFHQYLRNTYQDPAKMYVSTLDSRDGHFIASEEGCTQGDTCAMPFYGIATRPIIDALSSECSASQVWYADDSACTGNLQDIQKWWTHLCAMGPEYGYHPNAAKTILIVKREEDLDMAKRLFESTGVKITCDGERHLGAVIGNHENKVRYVRGKIEKWINDIEELATYAKEEPHLCYSAFVKAMAHRWTYVMRTVPGISGMLQPLEDCIARVFIPALLNREVSDVERKLIQLPVRYGGLGIVNPVEAADREYDASRMITAPLVKMILEQNMSTADLQLSEVKDRKRQLKNEKEECLKEKYRTVLEEVDQRTRRNVELATKKGASSWLTALPLKAVGYTLNKQEFHDSVCLRYGWPIHKTPKYCACGRDNTLYHTLDRKSGGYV